MVFPPHCPCTIYIGDFLVVLTLNARQRLLKGGGVNSGSQFERSEHSGREGMVAGSSRVKWPVTLHSIREQNARWLSLLSLVEEPRSTSQCLYSGWVFPRPEICFHGNSKSPQVDNDEPSHHHKSKAYTDELRHFGIHDARRQESSPSCMERWPHWEDCKAPSTLNCLRGALGETQHHSAVQFYPYCLRLTVQTLSRMVCACSGDPKWQACVEAYYTSKKGLLTSWAPTIHHADKASSEMSS